jgi:phage terminase large subunit-like protein
MVADKPKRTRGWEKKSAAEHKRQGTYRPSRHGPLVDLTNPLHPKPKHKTPAQRKRYPVPAKWKRLWKTRGVWTPQDDAAVAAGCWFDARFAEHFRAFCEKYLCLWEGRQWAGQPFKLMDWQWFDVFAPLFGWYRWDEEWGCPVRRFDRCYVEVAKKNGKSPMAAAVGCYFLAADEAAGGKVFSAASAREQAGIVHSHAMNMIQASPELAGRCKINRSSNTITFEHPDMFEHVDVKRTPANNLYASISSEAGPQEGRNANCIICDELHVWQGRKLWNALQYAFESRISPLRFAITTAGDDEQSVCFEQREYAEDVAAGHVHDLHFLGYIRAAGKDDDPGDVETWRKANPSLGITVPVGRMRSMYEEAKKKPASLATFKRYRLNVWGTVANPLIAPEAWDACLEEYTIDDLAGLPCTGGLDLSKTQDMTAFVLVFRDGDEYRQLAWFWLPEETYQQHRDRLDYELWKERGWLSLCPGPRIEESYIEDRIVWAEKQFDLTRIVYDPWRAAGLCKRLEEEHGIECVEFPQTITRFAAPTAEYESLISRGKMHHNGNGLLTWQSRHVKTKADMNKNERPVKPARGDVRTIDGIVAAIMALGFEMADEDTHSAYNDPEAELMLI